MRWVVDKPMWTALDTIPKAYGYLMKDIQCDVLVIGAGITGALCSYYLTQAGIQTVMVDQDVIGYGSTSVSTSILQYEIDTDLVGLGQLIGKDKAVQSFKLCEEAVYKVKQLVEEIQDPCGFSLQECFYYTETPSDAPKMKKEYDLRKEHGFDVEFIDSIEGKKRFSFPIEAGIYSRRGAGQINPYAFAHGLIRKAAVQGLEVYENTKITHMDTQEDQVVLKTHHRCTITAKKVIIATGYSIEDYIDNSILTLSRTFTIVTKPVKNFEGWYNRCIIRDNKDAYTYLRTTADDRIMIGGEDQSIILKEGNMANLAEGSKEAAEKYDILLKRAQKLFPNIPLMEIDYAFNGVFGTTKDELPYIGRHTKLDNTYFCLGYGANGILYAVLGAEAIRNALISKRTPVLDLFGFDRKVSTIGLLKQKL